MPTLKEKSFRMYVSRFDHESDSGALFDWLEVFGRDLKWAACDPFHVRPWVGRSFTAPRGIVAAHPLKKKRKAHPRRVSKSISFKKQRCRHTKRLPLPARVRCGALISRFERAFDLHIVQVSISPCHACRVRCAHENSVVFRVFTLELAPVFIRNASRRSHGD